MNIQTEAQGLLSSFLRDLGASAGGLAEAPLLVAITACLEGLTVALHRVGPGPGFLALPVYLFLVGFVGTQRVWFLRIYRGKGLHRSEILPLTQAFLGRFLVLGLAIAIPFAAAAVVLGSVAVSSRVGLVALALALDVALTFVTSALALSTRSVRAAVGQGLRMIAETWPNGALYVLTPGLVVVGLSATAPHSSAGAFGAALLGAAAALIALWFKGAVVAFYLRLHPNVSDRGSADEEEPAGGRKAGRARR